MGQTRFSSSLSIRLGLASHSVLVGVPPRPTDSEPRAVGSVCVQRQLVTTHKAVLCPQDQPLLELLCLPEDAIGSSLWASNSVYISLSMLGLLRPPPRTPGISLDSAGSPQVDQGPLGLWSGI